MKPWLIALLAVIAFIVIIGGILLMSSININNKMVTMEEQVNEKWSQVENVYQRRADLIPNLVSTVKGYAAHEQETFTQVIEARSKATSVNIDAANLNAASLQQFQQRRMHSHPHYHV